MGHLRMWDERGQSIATLGICQQKKILWLIITFMYLPNICLVTNEHRCAIEITRLGKGCGTRGKRLTQSC